MQSSRMKQSKVVTLILFITLSVGALTLPSLSFADLPVVNFQEMAQLWRQYDEIKKQLDYMQNAKENLTKQLSTAKSQLSTTKNQLTQAKQLVSDSEGHYGFGGLLNSASDLKQREWSPDNWQGALHGLSGGNPERYQQLVTLYKKNHHSLSQQTYAKGASKSSAQQYSQQVQVNQTVSVQAGYVFNDIKQHLQTIHTLSQQIEKTKNTKAAIDLQSRILTEVAYISVQKLKLTALLNKQVGEQSASSISGESDAAKFNTLPNQ